MSHDRGHSDVPGQPPPSADEPFRVHRLALHAVDPDWQEMELHRLLEAIGEAGVPGFVASLAGFGVASCWHEALLAHRATGPAIPGLMDQLKSIRLSEAMLYMAQKAAMSEIDSVFERHGITYAVIKGAHVREQVYADPALRAAADVDILVSRDQREQAIRVLLDAGYVLHADPENISHEATLTRNDVAIDLHWDILRPGRTRIEVAESLLARRQRGDGYWGLGDTDTVFLMLVHAAFAKYVCSPNMGLNRVFDFLLWVRKRPVDWDGVADMLQVTGLNTAAWTLLRWFAMLLAPKALPVPDEFIARIRPGRMRSHYLAYWLAHDLPSRWLQKPLRIQLGFTLFLHDRPADAWHALSGLLRARRMRNDDPLLLMRQTA